MAYIICILFGYLLGTFNPAYYFAKQKGFDIRKSGSTNAGTSNAILTMGIKTGILVGIIDILKAFISVKIAYLLFPNIEICGVIASVCCILGHIFPFYLGFNGGKGVASYLGMILAFNWRVFLVLGVSLLLITFITNYIALSAIFVAIMYPIQVYIATSDVLTVFIISIASLSLILKHRSNIKRILAGNEIGPKNINVFGK